jgi:hypothetical protein
MAVKKRTALSSDEEKVYVYNKEDVCWYEFAWTDGTIINNPQELPREILEEVIVPLMDSLNATDATSGFNFGATAIGETP